MDFGYTLNDWYLQQLKLNRKKMFGSSSEQAQYEGIEQINLFNEAEAESIPFTAEPTIESITYKRKKKKGGREKLLENLPVEVIEYRLEDDNQVSPTCQNHLHVMNKEIRKELKIIPAKVSVIEHVSYVYACRKCDKTGTETPVVTTPSPKALIPKSLVSPSVMAYIMSQKFVNAMPLYRQEQELKRLGVQLSRQTMSNWMIKGAQLLKPLVNKLKEELLSKDVLHADENTLEVLCEPERPAQANSYMWLYRTSKDSVPIVLYDYKEGRSGSYAKDYLKGFSGYLHTDGWGGYHCLEADGITLCGCWAHARRKFEEALSVLQNKTADSPEAVGLGYIQRLFAIEKSVADMTLEDRITARNQQSKTVVDEFYGWIDLQKDKTLP